MAHENARDREVDAGRDRPAQAPEATVLAPSAPAAPAILALQRAAGNHAVGLALGTVRAARLLQRDPVAEKPPPVKAGPPLPAGKNWEWQRQGMTFSLVASKQWLLDRGVSADAEQIEIAVVNEMLATIGEVAPWADLAALRKGVKALTLDGKLSELPPTFRIRVHDELAGLIGNPPGEEIVVSPSGGGATIFVDAAIVRPLVKDPSVDRVVDSAFSARLFGALEARLGQSLDSQNQDPGFRTTMYRDWEWFLSSPIDQAGRSVPFHLDGTDLETLFGEDWQARANKSSPKEAGRVKGHTVSIPEGMKEDWPKVMEVLKELLGPPEAAKKTDKPLAISESTALMLLKIAKSPLRAQIIARLKAGGGGADKTSSLPDVLESVIEEQELKSMRERLGISDPGTGGEEPVLKRPVHGNIMLTGGRPVPGKEAVFTFEVTDEVDALRAPMIQIQWVVYPQGKPQLIFDRELNTYSPLRGQGPINDKLFEVTFPQAGNYVVEAIVNHNFYRTAAFKTELKVLTEKEEVDLQEKGALAGFASSQGAVTKSHDFDVGGVTGALTDYEEGTITRGKLDPAFKTGTLADRMKALDAEIERVDKLQKQYASRGGKQAADVAAWAEDYLTTLREGRQKIEKEGKDARLIPCTGVYVSRSKKAPSKSLDLVCLQTRKADGTYTVKLHDLSQVYEPDNYEFEVDNDTAEGAYEEVFVEAAESYPDGTLSIAFQGWDEKRQEPTGSYVKFRKVTDTIGKDIKTNVFDPAINIAVNVAAAVMMVVPGLQAAGFALAVVWNTSQTIAELEEKAAKGTLKDKDFLYAGASFALDLLPVVGRSSRMISIGKKAFYVIEGVQLAGQALLITAQGMERVDKVRNGVIMKLAKLNERIAELERVNPSDPELEALKDQQERLIKEGEDATIEVFGGLIAENGLMMVGGALLQKAAIAKFEGRIVELEGAGKFQHRDGEKVRYDYDGKRIVGDRKAMTQAEFDAVERRAGLAEKLPDSVADPATRQRIVEIVADHPVDIQRGAKKTRLEDEGGRQVLRIADDATPTEILTEALRAKTGKAAAPEVPGRPRTGQEKAAGHRTELEHLEGLHKMAAAEGLDDFAIARRMRGQFIELENAAKKLPAGPERAELEAFLARYRTEVYEPVARIADRVQKAGGPKALDRFEQLKPEGRQFAAALSDDGLKAFFKIDHVQQKKLLELDVRALNQIKANDPARQAQIIKDIDAHARAAAQDVKYDVTNAAGTTRQKEGHPFREHGAHNTDAEMFARAAAGSTPKGRWSSPDVQVREVEHFRRRLMDPTVAPGDPLSPINAAGRNAINNGVVTREQILADPLTHDQYLKAQVDFHEQPSSNTGRVGTSFEPDGVTKKEAKKVTAIFQLDDNGVYQVLTAFPVE